jgi:hypothetical protein
MEKSTESNGNSGKHWHEKLTCKLYPGGRRETVECKVKLETAVVQKDDNSCFMRRLRFSFLVNTVLPIS